MKKKISLDDRIFIAGSNGMAGRAIHKSLKKAGYGSIKQNGAILTPTRKDLDLLKIDEVEKWFAYNKPSVVIIAAAKVGGILANASYPTEFLLDNLKIQINIIETSWKYKVKRLLFLGSSCIYPKFAKQPIKEDELLSGKLEKTNECYAIAKIAGIKLCEALRDQYGFDAISLMPTNLYGEGDNYDIKNGHVMASLIKIFYINSKEMINTVECWGTGSPSREFLHVDDLGDAVTFALENWDPNSPNAPRSNNGKPLYILNVGTGEEIKIKDLAEKISYLVNFKGKIVWDTSKPDGTPKKKLNIDRMTNLGWKAKISLEEGIVKTLKSLKNENFF